MDSGTDEYRLPTDFHERSGLMKTATTAKSPENKPYQAISGLDVHIGNVSKTTIR
jgi:hypothetical protein